MHVRARGAAERHRSPTWSAAPPKVARTGCHRACAAPPLALGPRVQFLVGTVITCVLWAVGAVKKPSLTAETVRMCAGMCAGMWRVRRHVGSSRCSYRTSSSSGCRGWKGLVAHPSGTTDGGGMPCHATSAPAPACCARAALPRPRPRPTQYLCVAAQRQQHLLWRRAPHSPARPASSPLKRSCSACVGDTQGSGGESPVHESRRYAHRLCDTQ